MEGGLDYENVAPGLSRRDRKRGKVVPLLATYRLELYGPTPADPKQMAPLSVSAVGLSLNCRKETAENLTKLLPDGYSVQIRPTVTLDGTS